jgi:hypothetical protein
LDPAYPPERLRFMLEDAMRLIGYCVPASGHALDPATLRRWCLRALPDFMIPNVFAFPDRLPLTPNGKVARAELPDPDARESSESYTAPTTEAEAVIARVWADVLGLERVGANDDFFELGGYSLHAAKVVSSLRGLGLAATPRHLFCGRSVAGLDKETAKALAEILPEEEYPQAVSFADGTPIPAQWAVRIRDRVLVSMSA